MITAVNVAPNKNILKEAQSCCTRCKELYGLISDHIQTEHLNQPPGNDKVLCNILLNILSLLVQPTEQITDNNTDTVNKVVSECQSIKETVDSRATVKQIEDSFTPDYSIASSVAPLLLNSTSKLTPSLAFQPETIPSTFFTNSLTTSSGIFSEKIEKPKQVLIKQPKTVNSVDFSSLMIGDQDNDYLSASASTLVTPEGNLTPAGISLLLANQTRNANTSGKSDLDVADILVNKMPIPSLNKGLDPNFLQLSTLYLQQIALNQQTQALSLNSDLLNGTENQNLISAAKKPKLNENLLNPLNIQNISSNHVHNLSSANRKSNVSNDLRVDINDLNTEITDTGDVSLQKLIARHKQISSLIEALNKKHNSKELPNKQNNISTSKTSNAVLNFSGCNSVVPPLISVAHTEGNSPSSPCIPVSLLMGSYKKLPKLVSTQAPLSGRLIIQQPPSSSCVSSDIQKIPVVFNVSPSTTIPTAASVQLVSSNVKEVPKNILLNAKEIPKSLHNMQNLVISNIEDIGLQNVAAKIQEVNFGEDADKNKFSTITMVPISDYDAAVGNNIPAPDSPEICDVATEDDCSSNAFKESKVLYKCDVCNVTFNVLSTLHTHMRTHMDSREEICNFCQMTFTDSDEFYVHVASHRGEENVFKCQFCAKIFTSKGEYTKHMTTHTQRRPYLCSFCQKSFRDPGSLTKHERIHTGEQPYVCETCHRGFAEKSSLRKHLRVHSGEKPYKCTQCDKSFSISGNLRRHMFIHTGQRPFKCNYCVKAFNNPSHLRRHIKNLHQKEKTIENENDM